MSEVRIPGRRKFLIGSGAAVATGMVAGILPLRARAQRRLKVGVYGGFFQDSFDEHIFPKFTEDTGIEVESISVPTGEAWLTQLHNAARAGQAPADVSMMANTPRLKGVGARVFAGLDPDALDNTRYLYPHFVHEYDDGTISGVGALSWYITLVSNTEVYPEAPESWGDMWNEEHRNRLGLLALATNSFLLEITATTFFGGKEILGTEDGIMEVLDKLAGIRPNVKLWYRDEAQFQQALQRGEIPMGQYYHDVATIARAEGHPVRSTFPAEGGVLDSGSWVVSRASDRIDEAQIFINYMCQPEMQARLARKVGTAPTVKRQHTDLTDEEFAAVSSDIDPIIPAYDMYMQRGDWISDRWTEMITG